MFDGSQSSLPPRDQIRNHRHLLQWAARRKTDRNCISTFTFFLTSIWIELIHQPIATRAVAASI